jgi:MoaA/NifB/PqqE/SkfB family radical SAM enzyme
MVFRTVPLDGALFSFDRDTGLGVLADGPETTHLVQRAPRVVQFGITNACNLACGFCSRDVHARSEWTVESAFALLAELARAGTLEVAFGGGEPTTFKGFSTLVRRLHEDTPLAVSFTTNGTRLDDAMLDALEGHVAQIRLSIYDDNDWRSTIARLAARRLAFGVNLLVTPARLPTLDALVLDMVGLGARDVLLLGYHGRDASMHLSPAQDAALAKSVRALGRACPGTRLALDVCFGARLPRLPTAHLGLARSDCGAGRDFVVVTSDRRVSPCSFHDVGFPIRDARDVLAVFDRERPSLSRAIDDAGCMRRTDAHVRLEVL